MHVFCLLLVLAVSAAAEVDFNREIRPILSDNCFACHGPDEGTRAMGLRLDTSQGAFERKGVIVPGDAAKSRLILRLSAEKPALRMPPQATGKTVSAKQIDLIKRWIDEGAEWKTHWAYDPPKRLEPPQVKGLVRNPIDQFVLARLSKEKMASSPEADRATLLRRVTLDLTGLPPTP